MVLFHYNEVYGKLLHFAFSMIVSYLKSEKTGDL